MECPECEGRLVYAGSEVVCVARGPVVSCDGNEVPEANWSARSNPRFSKMTKRELDAIMLICSELELPSSIAWEVVELYRKLAKLLRKARRAPQIPKQGKAVQCPHCGHAWITKQSSEHVRCSKRFRRFEP